MGDKVKEYLSAFAMLAFVAAILFGPSIYSYFKVTCQEESIEYTSSEVEDPDLEIGTTTTRTDGESGVKEVCTRGDETVVSQRVVTEPTDEVILIGTKEPETEEDYYYQDQPTGERTGAICGDGWRSFSTGSGTCSGHDHVAQWLY